MSQRSGRQGVKRVTDRQGASQRHVTRHFIHTRALPDGMKGRVCTQRGAESHHVVVDGAYDAHNPATQEDPCREI